MPTYIIEHLEPRLWKWCLIEYRHISRIVGRDNIWFTNIKSKGKPRSELSRCGKVFTDSVRALSLEHACILDPEASIELTSKDAKQFKFFVFGGILGDYPPKKRTKAELTPFVKGEQRSLGTEQMSTDTAVRVTKLIADGTPLSKIPFQDTAEIEIAAHESMVLPYRYILEAGKPSISAELISFLKRKKGF